MVTLNTRNPKKKKPKKELYEGQSFATTVVKFIAVWLTVFTIIVLVGFFVTGGSEPTQLVESVFAVVGVELLGLLFKRIMDKRIPKSKEEDDEYDD